MKTTNKTAKGLTFGEINNIPCLIKVDKPYTGYLKSKALKDRMAFPSIEFDYKLMLVQLHIGYRISQFQVNRLEYYKKNVFDFETTEIPVYWQGKDGLYYKDETDTKKVILPTKETLEAAFALEECVNLKAKQFMAKKQEQESY